MKIRITTNKYYYYHYYYLAKSEYILIRDDKLKIRKYENKNNPFKQIICMIKSNL